MTLAFLPKKKFMLRALELAREAMAFGEVPVGAVVVKDGVILGEGRNRGEREKNPLAHAELEAIAAACRTLNSKRLPGSELYVTLEPCPMCTGAVINAHIDTVVYAADDERAGCCGTAVDLFSLPYSHRPLVYRGFLEEEARALLQSFFRALREPGETGPA